VAASGPGTEPPVRSRHVNREKITLLARFHDSTTLRPSFDLPLQSTVPQVAGDEDNLNSVQDLIPLPLTLVGMTLPLLTEGDCDRGRPADLTSPHCGAALWTRPPAPCARSTHMALINNTKVWPLCRDSADQPNPSPGPEAPSARWS
jgi:hypothetical protein